MCTLQRYALLTSLTICSLVWAGDRPYVLKRLPSVPDCVGKWCCDDYCSKAQPCIQTPLRLCCDDYCRKILPCLKIPLCFGCDDYCRKCTPPICSPQCTELQCVRAGRCNCRRATFSNAESTRVEDSATSIR